MKTKDDNAKHHYFLIGAKVNFRTKEGKIGAVDVNAIVTSPSKNFPGRLLAKAQQIAQINFFKKIDEEMDTEVFDVFISGVNHLGLMTVAEFSKTLPGVSVSEKGEVSHAPTTSVNNPFEYYKDEKTTTAAKEIPAA